MPRVLHDVPLDADRALRLSVDGEVARLALLDRATGAELFAVPFEASVQAIRTAVAAAVRVAQRVAQPRVTAEDLWRRVESAYREAWELAPDDGGAIDRMTATGILGEYASEQDLAALVAAGRAAEALRWVAYTERRVAAAQRNIDPDAIPHDAFVAPPGSFAAFLSGAPKGNGADVLGAMVAEHIGLETALEDHPLHAHHRARRT